MSTFVLITGANRGLGQGLAAQFLAKPNHTVIAANRDPNHATSKALDTLPKGQGSRLILVKELREKHGVDRLDVVIPNAGIFEVFPTVREVQAEQVLRHVQVNTFGVVWLYQATRDLMRKSASPVFAPVGSGSSGLDRQPPVPNAAYGPSKVMVNWYIVKIFQEDPWITAFVLDPVFVQTEGGNRSAQQLGIGEKAYLEVDEVCEGMARVVVTSTKESYGGKIVDYKGEVLKW